MDALILELATSLGLSQVIGWFLPILTSVGNVLGILTAIFYYADKSAEYNRFILERKFGSSEDLQEYDFIVVGAGSAGSIIANRLSKRFNVLLLERGGVMNNLTKVPGLQGPMLGNREVDYMYKTVPQNNSCLALNNRQSQWNQGRGLGGGSGLNAMVYIRSHPHDYDRWARHTSDDSWKYNNLLRFFLRMEGFCDSCDPALGVKPSVNPKYHNSKGELPIRPMSVTPMVAEFLDGLRWAGVPKGDLNAPYFKPIADVNSYTSRNGERVNSFNAFVEPLFGRRSTLKVMKYARVTEVLFEPGTNRAIGVKYERFGKLEVAKASKEIILSAGSIASPKILMLSGIGPASHLKELGIPVRANLPVGRNLQDHVGTLLGPFLINKPVSVLAERDINQASLHQYIHNRTGLFAITFVRANTLWVSTRALTSGERDWPDIQVHFSSNGISQTQDEDMVRLYNMKPDVMKDFYDPVKGHDAFSLLVDNGRPKSRGVLRLKSKDFMDEPLIDPRYYEDSNQQDLHVILEGIQRALYFAENAPPFKRLGARLSPVMFPPCKHLPFRSDSYWTCFVRQFTLTIHHFVGTNSMGSSNSPDAVVDSKLRVLNVQGLRVIDASVMPYLVTTNTNAATMVVAERGSEFILQSYTK